MISKSTPITIGLVISVATLSFSIGRSQEALKQVADQVHAIELDRMEKSDQYYAFQREILQRLTRIETAVTKKKGD